MKRKGFTLVELLAVIVILAILMVSAGAGVMTALNNSKINTFKNEMLTIISGAESLYSDVSTNPAIFKEYIKGNSSGGAATNSTSAMCVTIAGVYNNGYVTKDIGTYAGVILVEIPHNGSAPTYMFWGHNSAYGINGLEKANINKLKFKKENNTSIREGGTGNATEISGGKIGIVSNLTGIRKMVTKAYGSDVTGAPADLTNIEVDQIESDSAGGGTGCVYTNIKCINVKVTS